MKTAVAGQSVGTRVLITNKGAENTWFIGLTQGEDRVNIPLRDNKDGDILYSRLASKRSPDDPVIIVL